MTSSDASQTTPVPITVARGDGIGPEIMASTLSILEAAGASLDIEEIEVGEKVFLRGFTSGMEPSAWDSLRRTKVFLKGPITTPQGGGYKSLNVTTRKTLGLYANVRPCVSYSPFVRTLHPSMDVLIVRENEEDTYAGIEHRQTDEVTQCLKLISRPGCERIARYAFEYARRNGRKKVTAFVKDNIMKVTDGLFRRVFEEVAAEYQDIQSESIIVDIGAARLADTPEMFDVLVMPNLYGDIMSDIAAQITGSVGLGGSANIGEQCAMFEAIHGSAPDIAGKDLANPSGCILGSVMMLNHIGQNEVAERVHNAWLRTLEDGIHTGDIFDEERSKQRVGTRGFTEALLERIGQKPQQLAAVSYAGAERMIMPPLAQRPRAEKALVGVDVFADWDEDGRNPDVLGKRLQEAASSTALQLRLITNRGVKVFPDGLPETFCTDHWRCRFVPSTEGATLQNTDVLQLLGSIGEAGIDFVKTEHLYTFDGERGYSLGQGE